MYLVECFINSVRVGRELWREDATAARQRKRGDATVFFHSRHAVAAARGNDCQSSATAPYRDDPARHYNFVQPALAHLPACLRRAFQQARSGAGETLKANDCING